MRRNRFINTTSLTGQWIALLLGALAVSQLVFFMFYRSERARALSDVYREDFFMRTAATARLLDLTEPELYPEVLRTTTTSITGYWLSKEAPDDLMRWQHEADAQLASIRPAADMPPVKEPAFERGLRWEELSPADWSGGRPARFVRLAEWKGFGISMPVRGGLWLNCVYTKARMKMHHDSALVIYYAGAFVTTALLAIVAVVLGRRVGRPLRRLTTAADALGRGEETPVPEDEGTGDIRCMAAAFNLMRARIGRFVTGRMQMVAAISHDLRTPITALRLQAEFVEDAALRGKMISTLDEMKAMTESTLEFAREDAVNEPTRAVALDALVDSVCEDFAALGRDVTMEDGAGAENAECRCRPDAMKRAVRNVIENAVRYGRRARVRVRRAGVEMAKDGVWLDIEIDDDGPGIAEADRERVFAPFVRLEESRNRATGGAGLGLAIARTILRAHGGDVILSNRVSAEGNGKVEGLRAVLRVPRPRG